MIKATLSDQITRRAIRILRASGGQCTSDWCEPVTDYDFHARDCLELRDAALNQLDAEDTNRIKRMAARAEQR